MAGTSRGALLHDTDTMRICALCGLVALLSIAAGKITDRRRPLNLSFSKMALFNEEPCAAQGGQCLEEAECPEDKLLARGLCPEQRKRGVECCHGVSVRVQDCRGQGGECTPSYCNPDIVVPANDCAASELCCVRVR